MMAREDAAASSERGGRGVAELLADLARETTQLFQQELALAAAELGATIQRLGTGAVEMLCGGLVLYAAFLSLLAAATLGLAEVLPAWAAALTVALVAGVIGAVLVAKGRHDVELRGVVTARAWRSLRQDAAWLRQRLP
jgi:hypothetical protein